MSLFLHHLFLVGLLFIWCLTEFVAHYPSFLSCDAFGVSKNFQDSTFKRINEECRHATRVLFNEALPTSPYLTYFSEFISDQVSDFNINMNNNFQLKAGASSTNLLFGVLLDGTVGCGGVGYARSAVAADCGVLARARRESALPRPRPRAPPLPRRSARSSPRTHPPRRQGCCQTAPSRDPHQYFALHSDPYFIAFVHIHIVFTSSVSSASHISQTVPD